MLAALRIGGRGSARATGAGRAWASGMPQYAPEGCKFESLLLEPRAADLARKARLERQWYLYRRQFERPLLAEYAKVHAEKEAEKRRRTALQRRLAARVFAALRRPLVEERQAQVAAQSKHTRENTRDWDAVRGAPTDVDFAEIIRDGAGAYREKTKFLGGHGVGELLPIEAFLFQTDRVFELDGFYHNMELEDERDNKLLVELSKAENEDKSREELLYGIYVEDVKERLDAEMMYKLKEAGLELKDPKEVEREQSEFAALPKEQRSKKLKRIHADVEFIRTEYIEPRGNPHLAFIERKARMKLNTRRLNLPEVVQQRLAELAGPRLCPETGVLTVIADEQPNKHQNTIMCMQVTKQLLEEAFLAFPCYAPLSDAEQSPLDTVQVEEPRVPVFVKEKKLQLSEQEQERKQEQDAIPEEMAMLISDDSEYKQFTDESRSVEEEVIEPFTLFRIAPAYLTCKPRTA